MSHFLDKGTIIQEIQMTGKYKGKNAFVWNIFGKRAGFTSTSLLNDVKEFDNSVALCPTLSASSIDLIGTNIQDSSGGTGIKSVKITYINNSNNIVQSGSIATNGTTLVTNVITNVNEVLWMEADDVGATGVSVGIVKLRINGGTVEVEQISAGANRSMSSRIMIPVAHKGYLNSWNCQSANNDQDVRLRVTKDSYTNALSTVLHFQDAKLVALNTNSGDLPLPWIQVPALSKIRVATISGGTGSTVKCEASFQIIIIAD